MIKNFFYIPMIILMITGCTSNPNDTNPNSATRGLLICEANDICPVVTVVWNETHKDILKVNLSLSSIYKK